MHISIYIYKYLLSKYLRIIGTKILIHLHLSISTYQCVRQSKHIKSSHINEFLLRFLSISIYQTNSNNEIEHCIVSHFVHAISHHGPCSLVFLRGANLINHPFPALLASKATMLSFCRKSPDPPRQLRIPIVQNGSKWFLRPD